MSAHEFLVLFAAKFGAVGVSAPRTGVVGFVEADLADFQAGVYFGLRGGNLIEDALSLGKALSVHVIDHLLEVYFGFCHDASAVLLGFFLLLFDLLGGGIPRGLFVQV